MACTQYTLVNHLRNWASDLSDIGNDTVAHEDDMLTHTSQMNASKDGVELRSIQPRGSILIFC